MKNLNKDLLIKEDKTVHRNLRYEKFKVWIEENDFDDLLYRIILEIKNDEYSYYEINNKLKFIIDYISNRINPFNIENCDCSVNFHYKFKGFLFVVEDHSNESVIHVYNEIDKKRLITTYNTV